MMLRRQIFYLSLYVAAILIPLLATLLQPVSDHPFLYEVGINFALIGIMIFALQVLLAGRFKWITNTFGLDTLIRFHRYMAMFATCLVIAHPLLLSSSSQNWSLLIGLDVPWYISFGRAALILLIANIVMSLYQSQFKIKFETWRIFHNIFGVSILCLAFIHSWFAGTSIQEIYFLKVLWVFLLTGSLSLFVYHRFVRPRMLSRHPYQVAEVKRESKDVWTIKLIPPQGFPILSYLPGQFHFVTFHRQGLPEEEHHWTLSSSPTQQGFISSTIKELGDFTAKMSQIRPGDTATVHGAFGRFSYLFYPKEKDFVFIAGGIGITPIISMLKSMRDTKMAFPVLLFYANKNEEDILFFEELEKMKQEGYPQLEIVHILSEPSSDWKEEKGHLDQEKIEKFCGDSLKDKAFYICGPQGLIDSIYKTLIQKNIKTNKIHTEIFSFLD